jgi:hypothetical protein
MARPSMVDTSGVFDLINSSKGKGVTEVTLRPI